MPGQQRGHVDYCFVVVVVVRGGGGGGGMSSAVTIVGIIVVVVVIVIAVDAIAVAAIAVAAIDVAAIRRPSRLDCRSLLIPLLLLLLLPTTMTMTMTMVIQKFVHSIPAHPTPLFSFSTLRLRKGVLSQSDRVLIILLWAAFPPIICVDDVMILPVVPAENHCTFDLN